MSFKTAAVAIWLILASSAQAVMLSGNVKDLAECAAYATIAGYDNRISADQKWNSYNQALEEYAQMRPNESGARLVVLFTEEMNRHAIDAAIATKGNPAAAIARWNVKHCADYRPRTAQPGP